MLSPGGNPLPSPHFSLGGISQGGDHNNRPFAVADSPMPLSEKMLRADGPPVAAGRLSDEVYANTLPWWRSAVRRKLVQCVEWESEVLAQMQVGRLGVPHASVYVN